MSNHFVDPEYQKEHHHDIMGGTPHIPDEDKYRHEEHKGRHVLLSDTQFEESYPTAVEKEQVRTLPAI